MLDLSFFEYVSISFSSCSKLKKKEGMIDFVLSCLCCYVTLHTQEREASRHVILVESVEYTTLHLHSNSQVEASESSKAKAT